MKILMGMMKDRGLMRVMLGLLAVVGLALPAQAECKGACGKVDVVVSASGGFSIEPHPSFAFSTTSHLEFNGVDVAVSNYAGSVYPTDFASSAISVPKNKALKLTGDFAYAAPPVMGYEQMNVSVRILFECGTDKVVVDGHLLTLPEEENMWAGVSSEGQTIGFVRLGCKSELVITKTGPAQGIHLNHTLLIPDDSPQSGNCENGEPAGMSGDADADAGFNASYPAGESNNVSVGNLTCLSSTPQAMAQVANWRFYGEGLGATKAQTADHLQIKSATRLLDMRQEAPDQLVLETYDLTGITLGAPQGGFYPLPATGLLQTVTYTYNGTTGVLQTRVEKPGQAVPQVYELGHSDTTSNGVRTVTHSHTDANAGITRISTVEEAFNTGSPAMDVRHVITEERRDDVCVSKVKETYRRPYLAPPALPGVYRLEERAVDPDGANLVTTYGRNDWGEIVRTLNPDGSWSFESRLGYDENWQPALRGAFGGLDQNAATLSAGGGVISAVSYRPWLDGPLPGGDTPALAQCVAEVSKYGTVDDAFQSRNETWTAGVLSRRVDTWTTQETEGGQTYTVSHTRTWHSAAANDFLTRSEWTHSNGQAYKTVGEDGGIKRHARTTAGDLTERMTWDVGLPAGVGTRTITLEDAAQGGRIVEKRVQVDHSGQGDFADMSVETWEYTRDTPTGGATLGRLNGEKHFINGLLADETSYPTPRLTITKTAGGAEVHTLTGEDGEVVSVTEKIAGAPDIVTTYGTHGRTRSTTRSAGGLSQTTTSASDVAGRSVAVTDEQGITRGTGYAQGGRVVTTTRPGGVTEIETRHLDGQTASITGSGVVATYYAYSVDAEGFLATTQRSAGSNSPRFTTSVSDWSGRTRRTIKPSPALTGTVTETRSYDNAGRLVKIAGDNGTAAQIMVYDAAGRVSRSGLDLNGDGALTAASTDRLTETNSFYQLTGGRWWSTTTRKAYHTNGNGTDGYLTTQREAVAPIASGNGLRWTSISEQPGGLTLTTERDAFLATQQGIVTQDSSATAVSPDSRSEAIGGRTISSSDYGTAKAATYAYDALGRQIKTIDARGGVTRTEYNAAGQVIAVRNHLNQATAIEYYPAGHASAGLQKQITNPAGETTVYGYDALGRVTAVSGTGAYPLAYGYNAFGELETLTTHGTQTATTTWHYDAASGVLKDKTYADGNKTAYTYHAHGKTHTRTWQRGVTTTYTYDGGGVLTGIDYSDATPDVAITPDRLGRPTEIIDGGGTLTKTYHADLPVEASDEYASNHAHLPNLVIERAWDAANARRSGIAAKRGGTTDHTIATAYDSAGRLGHISDAHSSHLYSYAPGTGLITGIEHQNGSLTISNETRSLDLAGRLIGIQTTGSNNAVISRHGYMYDPAGRRSRATREDGQKWEYGYNARGEVTSGKKHLPNGQKLAGQQFEYAYDGIGNRLTAKSGGDASGNNLRTTGYTPNALNQYSALTTPNSFDVLGRAPVSNSVTVNGQATQRQGEAFRSEVSGDNSASPLWQAVSVSDGTTTQAGHRYLAKASVSPAYDADGNLTDDGRWVYTWDAENRLTSMTTTSTAQTAGVPYQRLVFAYDGMSRRVSKQVFDSPTGAAVTDLRFAYDGWNLIAEYSASGSVLSPLRTYTWGTDLSGTPQGAGGVGGLLSVSLTSHPSPLIPCYDGNGNVSAWLNASGQLAAKQDYDPFGNRIVKEGSVDLPIGFSTKYTDQETGLCYYGYRYYDPKTGRWLGRDPKRERGGNNLYAFINNCSINECDVLGRIGLAGLAVGIIADYSIQVSINYACGKRGHNMMFDVNVTSMVVSGGLGFIGAPGAGGAVKTALTKGKSIVTLAKRIKKSQNAGKCTTPQLAKIQRRIQDKAKQVAQAKQEIARAAAWAGATATTKKILVEIGDAVEEKASEEFKEFCDVKVETSGSVELSPQDSGDPNGGGEGGDGLGGDLEIEILPEMVVEQ